MLAARRTTPPALAGRWEFPGGKVEPGEDPVTALRRELAEELGVSLTLGGELVPDDSPRVLGAAPAWPLGPGLELRIWLAVADGVVAGSTDHDRLRWLAADQLGDLDWLPGDRPILARLSRVLGPRRRPATPSGPTT